MPENNASVIGKKKRDYVFLLTFLILSFIAITPLEKMLPDGSIMQRALMSVTIMLWYIYSYRVTANFYVSKWVRGAYAFLLVFQLTFNSFLNTKINVDVSTLAIPASIAYLASLIGFSLIFYILLKDIFSQKHDLSYSLLGAANIYMMIPLLFCYIYALIAVQNPTIVHADPTNILTVLFKCLYYSLYVLAGIDYPGEKIGEAVQSIAIFESLFGSLFIVFIIGRLMTK